MKKKPKYPIKYVAVQSGLTPNLLRTWENRYDVVKPGRAGNNRRLYSEEDLYKLKLIKSAIDNGFKIGELSGKSLDEIEKLANSPITAAMHGDSESAKSEFSEEIGMAVEYIRNFKAYNLKNLIDRMVIQQPKKVFIENFVFPLLLEIGNKWETGELMVSHEHFASAIIMNVLGSLIEHPVNEGAPTVITAAPRNQHHEMAAIALSVLISTRGMRVVYLGSSIPAEHIISSAQKMNAFAVVLSIIYPTDDFTLLEEFRKLEKYSDKFDIYIGGSSALPYYRRLKGSSAKYLEDINQFLSELNKSRSLA